MTFQPGILLVLAVGLPLQHEAAMPSTPGQLALQARQHPARSRRVGLRCFDRLGRVARWTLSGTGRASTELTLSGSRPDLSQVLVLPQAGLGSWRPVLGTGHTATPQCARLQPRVPCRRHASVAESRFHLARLFSGEYCRTFQ